MKDEPKTYGNKDVTEVMKAFHDFTGLKPMPEHRQRQYASTLIKVLGDKTMDAVRYAIKIQDDYYAPQVTSPKDMYYKLDKVMAYYRKNEGQSNGKVLKI